MATDSRSPRDGKSLETLGWYDPKNGKPFIWQEAYAPSIREGNLSRLWLVYSSIAPSSKAWPKRALNDAQLLKDVLTG